MDLKLKDLRYLVAVADPRHFGRAAERCFVSQPTLSAQLKKLEQYLGVQLIERAPNNVCLTPAGEEIVARARRILEASDEVVTLARTQRDPLAGKLAVALLPTIGPYLLPRVLPAIRKALPRLELRLYEYQTAPMLEKLHGGELDLGILALPVELDGLESRELYREPFIVALPEQHRLARRDSVRVADLQERDAAAAGGRPLPARPGAGGLQPRRRAREAGLPRHEPGDAATDGGRRRRHHAAAGARQPRRLWQRPRRGAAAVRQAGAGTHASVRCGARARRAPPAIDALARLIAEHAR